jgi:glucose/mannose transport system substrate-binding protein
MKKFRYLFVFVLLTMSLLLASCQPAAQTPDEPAVVPEEPAEEVAEESQLEIFSWWTAGGEAEGLNAMFEIYSALYPEVEIINATVAGGAGTNAKAVLATRLQGGDPPDSFQVHAGLEVEKYEPSTYLVPIDDMFDPAVFPQDLLDLLLYEGHYWTMPVNIHRSNVLWYNPGLLEANNVAVPTTMEEFFAACETLEAAGLIPIAMGTKDGWEAAHVFESFLPATLGADAYRGLWTGEVSWEDPGVTQALEDFLTMMEYVNEDHSALTWDAAGEYIIADQAAFMIMGDWAAGWFASKGYADFGWAPPPGTQGIFVALSDAFALPKNAPNEQAAIHWLEVCGSKEGQEAFNPAKGSICARTDCDPAAFEVVPETYAYLTSAAEDWASDDIVPSVVHGAASYESWATDFKDVLTLFVTSGDVAAAQSALADLCVMAGICQ